MSDPVVRIKLEYYNDDTSLSQSARQAGQTVGEKVSQAANGGIGGGGAAAAAGAMGGGMGTSASTYSAGRALAGNPEYGGDLFREREYVRQQRASQIAQVRQLVAERNTVSQAMRQGVGDPEELFGRFEFAQSRINSARSILNRFDADEDRLGARSYRTEAGARIQNDRMRDRGAQRFNRSDDAAQFAAHRAGERGMEKEGAAESRRIAGLNAALQEGADKELANSKREEAEAHREAARKVKIANANFDAGVANMKPNAAFNALNSAADEEADPMRAAQLRRQAGRFRPKSGMNQQVMSTGMFMNALFGGMEVAHAFSANSTAEINAPFGKGQFGGVDSLMGGVDQIAGGFLGSVAGLAMDATGYGPTQAHALIEAERARSGALDSVEMGRYGRGRQLAEMIGSLKGDAGAKIAAIETKKYDNIRKARNDEMDANRALGGSHLGDPTGRNDPLAAFVVGESTQDVTDPATRSALREQRRNAKSDRKAASYFADIEKMRVEIEDSARQTGILAEAQYDRDIGAIPSEASASSRFFAERKASRRLLTDQFDAKIDAAGTDEADTLRRRKQGAVERFDREYAAGLVGVDNANMGRDAYLSSAHAGSLALAGNPLGATMERIDRERMMAKVGKPMGMHQAIDTSFGVDAQLAVRADTRERDLINNGLDTRLRIGGIMTAPGSASQAERNQSARIAEIVGRTNAEVRGLQDDRPEEAKKARRVGLLDIEAFRQETLRGFSAVDVASKNSLNLSSGPGVFDPRKFDADIDKGKKDINGGVGGTKADELPGTAKEILQAITNAVVGKLDQLILAAQNGLGFGS